MPRLPTGVLPPTNRFGVSRWPSTLGAVAGFDHSARPKKELRRARRAYATERHWVERLGHTTIMW